jgi:urease accessory protein
MSKDLFSHGLHALKWGASAAVFGAIAVLLSAPPASAHHPFGGTTPSTFFEGFLSGLGHPVIGLDHLTFVVAIGLLSALHGRGLVIPTAFVVAAMGGTVIHLFAVDLPAVELVISASVLGFGVLLARKAMPNLAWVVGLAAIAGIFHGYAYGEAIVGAEMNPIVAYLAGFTLVQLGISWGAFAIGKMLLQQVGEQPSLSLRFAGFTICGIGATFLATSILG